MEYDHDVKLSGLEKDRDGHILDSHMESEEVGMTQRVEGRNSDAM